MNSPTNESIFLYLPGINSCECLNKQTALVPNYFNYFLINLQCQVISRILDDDIDGSPDTLLSTFSSDNDPSSLLSSAF